MHPARRLTVLSLLLSSLVACGGQSDLSESIVTATIYVEALAEADYDTMAAVSVGPANVAARYGQQVLLADPRAFGSRDLEILQPLNVPDGGDGSALDGSLELTTKGIDGAPLRIGNIRMEPTSDGWAISSYDRDGRGIGELFHDVTAGPHVLTVDGINVATASASILLTDVGDDVVLLPIAITAGPGGVTVIAERSAFTVGDRIVEVTEITGPETVEPQSEAIVLVIARDVDDPGDTNHVSIGLDVDGASVGPLEFDLETVPPSQ